MRLTIAEARALGIAEEYLRDLKPIVPGFDAERSRAVREDLAVSTGPEMGRPGDGMNKLERSFAVTIDRARASGSVKNWWFEAFKVRIAGRCFYTPDFTVDVLGDRLTFVETKGPFAREDSIIKIKSAASLYPCCRWLLVRRANRHDWSVWEVTRSGISRESIAVAWIEGSV